MLIPLQSPDAVSCEGKAGTLAALMQEGYPVPGGLIVPASCSDPGLPTLLDDQLHQLGTTTVAVRSSASTEDTSGYSAAGQFDSVLGVPRTPTAVADAVRRVRQSIDSPGADAYRRSHHLSSITEPRMDVLVQEMVDADVSGVMFTPDAETGVTRIEASWGLGPTVVGGTVTPDSYTVSADGSVTRRIGDKTRSISLTDGGTTIRDTSVEEQNRATLHDDLACRVAALGRRIAEHLGGPQDIEWAVTGDSVRVLQSRPVTRAVPPEAAVQPPDSGTPGSPGTATGTARVLRNPADAHRLSIGDILICPFTDPAWTPLFRGIGGIVTETGGALSHAAIVAREHGIPAVIGLSTATTLFDDGVTLTINGTTGTVTATEELP